MANDFDQMPLYDKLVSDDHIHMSEIWKDYFATFFMDLTSYLSGSGIFPPQLTTAQRDARTSTRNGQLIYNTDLDSLQYLKAGVWTSI